MREIDFGEIIPKLNDRVFVAGQTGSGKTTLVQVLLEARKYVVVLDIKGTMRWGGYKVVESLGALTKLDPVGVPKIIYKPTYQEMSDRQTMNKFFRWVYDRQRTTLYVDELSGVSRGDDYPAYYGACLMRGRELGIEVISGAQRPTYIPQIAMSEAEHVYSFKLKMVRDRERMEALTGIPSNQISALHKREFLYAPQDGDVVGPIRLRLADRPSGGPVSRVSSSVAV